jgi:ArsR family transcriptional regulator
MGAILINVNTTEREGIMPVGDLLPVIQATACCSPLTRDALGASEADHLAHSLKALADPTRLRLVSIVAASHNAEACVCDLTACFELSQPTISHHLKVLTDAGFLSRSQRGTWAWYSLVPGALDSVAQVLVTA